MLPSAAGLALTLMLMTVTLLCWMLMPPQPQPHLDEPHLCADGQGAVALVPAHEGQHHLSDTIWLGRHQSSQFAAQCQQVEGCEESGLPQSKAHPERQGPGQCQQAFPTAARRRPRRHQRAPAMVWTRIQQPMVCPLRLPRQRVTVGLCLPRLRCRRECLMA
jgi:hypothetical protein